MHLALVDPSYALELAGLTYVSVTDGPDADCTVAVPRDIFWALVDGHRPIGGRLTVPDDLHGPLLAASTSTRYHATRSCP